MSANNPSNPIENSNTPTGITVVQAIEMVSRKEPTNELQIYWQQRYEEIVNDKLFAISSQTLSLLEQDTPIEKPTTPIGSINLLKHLNTENNVKEYELQNTIEAAVRLLDGFLDVINFAPGARNLVSEYRKIGISLDNLPQFLSLHQDQKPEHTIDSLGSLISNCCYRASESVAEEKGHCLKWDQIKQLIRPKPFEYWYNTETGEIKNGLEISQTFTQDTIKESNFEIVPRRNSHILLYPGEEMWQKWSDRAAGKNARQQPDSKPVSQVKNGGKKDKVKSAQTSPEPVNPTQAIENNLPQSIFSAVPESILPNFIQSPATAGNTTITNLMPEMIPLEDVLPGILGAMPPDSADQIKNILDSGSFSQNVVEVLPTSDTPSGTIDQAVTERAETPDQPTITQQLSEPTQSSPESKWFSEAASTVQQEEKPAEPDVSDQADLQLANQSDIELTSISEPQSELLSSTSKFDSNPVLDGSRETFVEDSTYQIGEIVKLTQSGQYFQIINTVKENAQVKYQLTDNDQGIVITSVEGQQIEPASLEIILTTINKGLNPIGSSLKGRLIIFNSLGQIGLIQSKQQPLPEFSLSTKEKIEHQIQTFLQSQYDIISGDIEEVGLFVDGSDFALVYYVQIPEQTQSLQEVGFIELDQAMDQVGQLNSYLEKLSKQEIVIQKRLTSKEREIEDLRRQLTTLQGQVLGLGVDLQALGLENRTVKASQENLQAQSFENRFSQKYLSEREGLKLSKLVVYAEQLINVADMGQILVRVQYDSLGVKDVTIDYADDQVSLTNRNIIKTYISLANTSLGGGTGLHDMAAVLEQQSDPQFDFGSGDINKILYAISQALYSMPSSLDLLNLKDLATITLPDIMEAKKTGQSVLKIILNK